MARLVALEKALASGVRSVSYDGKSTTFGSFEEMWALRSRMRAALGLTTRSKTRLAAHDRGAGGGIRGE